MRTVSPNAIVSINAAETDEVWLAMLVLDHGDFDETIRLVANGEPITHFGNVFEPFPFRVTLPDEGEGAKTLVRFEATNVSLELTTALLAIEGAVSGSIFWVLADTPDVVEVGPLDLEIRGIEYNALTITGSMVVEPIRDLAFGSMRMDTVNAPGNF